MNREFDDEKDKAPEEDWLALFPEENGRTDAWRPTKLIDLPDTPESPPPEAIAGAPRTGGMEVLYPPGQKRANPLAIAASIFAVTGTIAFVYWLLRSPAVHSTPAPVVQSTQASSPQPDDTRLTVEPLAPAPAPSPSPSLLPSPSPSPVLSRTPSPAPTKPPDRTLVYRLPSATPTTAAKSPPPPLPVVASSAQNSAGLVASTPVTIGSPPPAPPSPSPSPTPVATPARTPDPAPSATPAAKPAVSENAAVQIVLDGYRAAYDSLHAESVKSVWPGADTRALARAFAQLSAQSVDFYTCGIEVDGATAEAHCSGAVTFIPKVGGKTPRAEPRQWSFYLKKQNERWLIDRVVSR